MERRPCGKLKGTEDCRVFDRVGYCFEDEHHKYFPKADYQTSTEKQFRELEENKIYGCRDKHNEDHATQPIPTKPELFFMVEAIKAARRAKKDRRKAA
jgi:hypothetical protein